MPDTSSPTTIFIRDDDIGAWTPGAAAFVDTFRSRAIPVSYQVIPALLTQECADKLRAIHAETPELIELGQHGLEHRMTVGGKQLSHEFGRERDYTTQRAVIRKGREMMTSLLGPAFDGRMFTPPRHRFNRHTVIAAADEGFDIFSAASYCDRPRQLVYRVGRSLGLGSIANRGVSYHPEQRPEASIRELSIAVAVDDGAPRSRRVGDVMGEINRAAKHSTIVGLMLHHEAWHSNTGRQFLDELASFLVERSDLRIALPRDLVARSRATAFRDGGRVE